MAELITGIFYNRASAEAAVDKLENFGYERDDISVIMHDRTMAKEFAADTGTTAGTAHKAADAAKSAAKVAGALAAILAGAAATGPCGATTRAIGRTRRWEPTARRAV